MYYKFILIKAHFPPETSFSLGTLHEGTGNKQYEIYMSNPIPISPMRSILYLLTSGVVLDYLGFTLG